MEQKQNSQKNVTEHNQPETAAGRKVWITPELRVMPVPTSTQTGKRAKTVAEFNASYHGPS